MSRSSKTVAFFCGLLSAGFGIVFALLLSEASYRSWLYSKYPEKFHSNPHEERHPAVHFFQNSVWQFNEEFGYTYIPNSRWQSGFIQNGTLTGCDGTAITNEMGNMGIIRQPYKDAQVRILLFGDSVTMQPRENQTYANFLEARLRVALGKTVSVMNFGRDGYGVLQMFDLARRKVAEYEPHLVLFAPITDDFTRARFWRTVNVINGRKRLLTTIEPQEQADLAKSTDTLILNERASQAWCNSFAKEKRLGDPVVAEIEEAYREAKRHSSERPPLTMLEGSFLYNRIVYGEPFSFVYRRLRPSTNPRISFADYATDPRMVQNVRAIAAGGVPYVLLQLPVYEELTARRYLMTDQQRALVSSLEAMTGRRFYRTLDYSDLDTPELNKFKHNPHEGVHPSVWGLKYHAEAITNLLEANGFLAAFR